MGFDRYRFTHFIEGKWFALVDLGIILACAGLWYAWPALGAWPLLLTLLPWVIRYSVGLSPFRRSPVNLLLLVFILTAAVGVWASYDQEEALHKFWILISAVLVYYALTNQPRTNITVVFSFFGVLGFLIAIYFLFSNNWEAYSEKFETIQRVANLWVALRPFQLPSIMHPNDAASLMAMMAPFLLYVGRITYEQRRLILSVLSWVALLIVGFGFFLTSSRGAWIAVGGTLLIWFCWLLSGFITRRHKAVRPLVFGVAMLLVSLFLLGSIGLTIASLSNPPSAGKIASLESRISLARDTLFLIEDFPITGAGLRSFPGLYSQYILAIPFFNTIYSHNMFLDATLEQGIFGGVSLFLIFTVTGLMLLRVLLFENRTNGILSVPPLVILASMSIAGVHSFVDDTLYGNLGTPLLFVLPGLAMAWGSSSTRETGDRSANSNELSLLTIAGNIKGLAITFVLILIAGTSIILRGVFIGTWHANMGSVALAKFDLANWPTNEWSVQDEDTSLGTMVASFQDALRYKPADRTAHHRLGLVAMMQRDYEVAVFQLEQAYKQANVHHGIKKNLAYAYVWTGKFEKALPLLMEIPEARQEMEVYAWWWGTQGEEQLAMQASQAAELFPISE